MTGDNVVIKYAIAHVDGTDFNGSGIYCIENLINGKVYVGSSVNIKKRWNHHYAALNRGLHTNRYLQNAWRKYGSDSFLFYVLENVEANRLVEVEQRYLDNMRSYDEKIGYNLSHSSEGIRGVTFSESIRKKFSIKRKAFFQTEEGKKAKEALSVTVKERMSGSSGKNIKEKIAVASRINNKKPEVREKNRQSQIERYSDKKNLKSHRIAMGCQMFVCEQTGKKYLSTIEAAKDLGISNNIWNVLNGKSKQAKGFTFRYIDEHEEIEIKPMTEKPKRSKGTKILCVTTGETFDTVKAASIALGVQTCAIHSVLRGEWKHTHGLVFQHLD